jgi:hypothetical protein
MDPRFVLFLAIPHRLIAKKQGSPARRGAGQKTLE